MLKITLPSGDVREVELGTTVEALCRDISMGLFSAATAAKVNGAVVDLRTALTEDCAVEILTFNDEDGRKAYRHTVSHILAQAVKDSLSITHKRCKQKGQPWMKSSLGLKKTKTTHTIGSLLPISRSL